VIHAKPLKTKGLRVRRHSEPSTNLESKLDHSSIKIESEVNRSENNSEGNLLISPYVRFTTGDIDNVPDEETSLDFKLPERNTNNELLLDRKKAKIIEYIVVLKGGNIPARGVYDLATSFCKSRDLRWTPDVNVVYSTLLKLVLEDRLVRIKINEVWHYYPKHGNPNLSELEE
jgi:hypothetical protein